MEALELLDLIAAGETSEVQFKETINSPDQLMTEMVALCNSKGGKILVGVGCKYSSVAKSLVFQKLILEVSAVV